MIKEFILLYSVPPDCNQFDAPIEQNLRHISPTLQRHCSYASFDSFISDDCSEDKCIDKKSIQELENPDEAYDEIDLQKEERFSEVETDIYATITKTVKPKPVFNQQNRITEKN